MIEKIIRDYLTGEGVTVYLELPKGGGTPPFVLIERTGGSVTNCLRSATVAIQSYGATLYDAAALNERVLGLMDGIRALPEIAACELNSDYNYTDTAKKRYRYQAVYDLVYYD